jgi:hypothetical protein
MELTPEERQRIYLEEQARIEARRQIESKRVTPGKVVGLVALGLVGLLFLLFVFGLIIDAGKTPEERAHDELEACLNNVAGKTIREGIFLRRWKGRSRLTVQCGD